MHLKSRKYVFHLGNMTKQDLSDKLINKTARFTITFTTTFYDFLFNWSVGLVAVIVVIY